jgi:hypothetical protein
MKTKTDLKAGYANTKLEMPSLTIDRLVLPEIVGRVEGFDERPSFKTGHTVTAILE